MTVVGPVETGSPAPPGLRLRALLLGERINTAGLEPEEVVTTAPLSFRVGEGGFAVVFRYGAVVLVGLGPAQEQDLLSRIGPLVVGAPTAPEDETVTLLVTPDQEGHINPAGAVHVRSADPERLLIVAEVLGKSVALAGDERQVTEVLDVIEPFAAALAAGRRWPGGRRGIVRLIGRALLVQHRLAGRVGVRDKPDILWDRPDLERLYHRLEDEYEVIERAEVLDRKLAVISTSANALVDFQDTARALRLELMIVLLIVAELLLWLAELLGLIRV